MVHCLLSCTHGAVQKSCARGSVFQHQQFRYLGSVTGTQEPCIYDNKSLLHWHIHRLHVPGLSVSWTYPERVTHHIGDLL